MNLKFVYLSISIVYFSCSHISFSQLNIATSSNFYPTLKKIIEISPMKSNINLITGSSGQLFNQIKYGAPIDIFFSADSIYPTRLHHELQTKQKPEIYAYGQLILVTQNKENLNRNQFNRFVIADTLLAPYGIASLQFIKKSDFDITQVIYALNINQANSYILTGAVDIGLTSKSFIYQVNDTELYWVDVDPKLYSKIKQCYLILRNSDVVKSFFSFFNTDEVHQIISENGYILSKSL